MSHILVATLGDSPIVVTSMFDLLTEQERLTIDEVVLLHPEGDNRAYGFSIIDEALKGKCSVESCELPFEDTYTEETCFEFLHRLFILLDNYQRQGDTIYLSLAGGRKHMSALIALAAPFYECIKGLYHVIDKDEYTDKKNFKTIQELKRLFDTNDEKLLTGIMHPSRKNLQLVPIPLKNALHVSESYLQKLLTMTPEQVQDLWEREPDEADAQQFMLNVRNPNIAAPLLNVYLTEQAKKEYETYGANLAHDFALCFENMRFAEALAGKARKKGPLKDPKGKKHYPCYVYKRGSTAERPFFHTEPEDIRNYPQSRVNKVIIERLAKHRTETEYIPSTNQLLETRYSEGEKLYMATEVINGGKQTPAVLIIPMGTQPMVATQIYTLLTTREGHAIQKVILVYLEKNDEVANSFRTAKSAFDREQIKCEGKPIQGRTDIVLPEDCDYYQSMLEQIIKELETQFPKGCIDLALSGRKGMAALALFTAQQTNLKNVYHTIIANKALDRRIEFEMRPTEFSRLKPDEKNEKLFLRRYKEHDADFRLFKVPVGPLFNK